MLDLPDKRESINDQNIREEKMDLIGERMMKAVKKIAQVVSNNFDIERANDRSYLEEVRQNLFEPTVVKWAKKEPMVIQAYIAISPHLTPSLGPDEDVAGVNMCDMEKGGQYRRFEHVRVKDLFPNNPYMQWYFEAIKRGIGVWSNVYFDPQINRDVISYTLPIYTDGRLVGVTGLDLDYQDFRETMNNRLIEIVGDKIALIKKEHEALELKDFSGQYINMDTLELVAKDNAADGFISHSKEMKQVMKMVVKAAISTANILILGETGVGKDFFASYIHSNGKMRKGQFISVNCSAIPENLLESEFFGYEKGAFTGAKSEGKPGFFELANGGTIFLNEIGEVPLHLQAKFLSVIQQKNVTRVGGTVAKKIDFRLIAATNRNLPELISQGKFREDLYYRLNVIPIFIPPLRQRKDDIISFMTFFLYKNMQKYEIKRKFSPTVIEAALNYSWPGNIRELENVVERLVVTSDSLVIDVNQLPAEFFSDTRRLDDKSAKGTSLKDMLQEYEAAIIRKKYSELGSSYKVAEELGISQSQATRKIREYVGSRVAL